MIELVGDFYRRVSATEAGNLSYCWRIMRAALIFILIACAAVSFGFGCGQEEVASVPRVYRIAI